MILFCRTDEQDAAFLASRGVEIRFTAKGLLQRFTGKRRIKAWAKGSLQVRK